MFDAALQHVLLTQFPFETRMIVVGTVLLGILCASFFTHHYWKRIYHAIRRRKNRNPIFKTVLNKPEIRHAVFDVLFVLKLVLLAYVIMFSESIYSATPSIIATTPERNSRLQTNAEMYEIVFDIPVDIHNITFNVSPDIEGTVNWVPIHDNVGYYRTLQFIPDQSFYPGDTIVFYIVGVRNAWTNEASHEMAIELTAPRLPEVVSTTVDGEASKDVAVDQNIIIEYSDSLGTHVDLLVEMDPPVDSLTARADGKTQIIEWQGSLQQSQTYTLMIQQTPRSYLFTSGEDVLRGETQELLNTTFTTATAPFIEEFSPQGSNVLPSSPIKVIFDTEMNPESVQERISIDPEIETEQEWESETTLLLKPTQKLAKDQSYTVSIASGAETAKGGRLEEDATFQFKTIGAVGLISTSPGDTTSGVATDPRIYASFNQPVDQESAQAAFTIYPAVTGSFEWEGNSMIFTPSTTLAYGTKYTVTLNPGIVAIEGDDSIQPISFSFTTKLQIFTIPVPYYRQEETFTCNVAAARMALAYKGVYHTEDTIQHGIGIGQDPNSSWVEGYGTHIGPINAYVSQYRPTSVHTGWNLTAMLNEVKAGNPVVFWEYNRYSQPYGSFTLNDSYTGYNGMHSEVVIGYIGTPENPSHVITNDPWRGRLTYDAGTFKSVWGYLNNTALVVK